MFTVQAWILMSPGPHKKPPLDITVLGLRLKEFLQFTSRGNVKEEKFSCRKRKGSDFRESTSIAVLYLVEYRNNQANESLL